VANNRIFDGEIRSENSVFGARAKARPYGIHPGGAGLTRIRHQSPVERTHTSVKPPAATPYVAPQPSGVSVAKAFPNQSCISAQSAGVHPAPHQLCAAHAKACRRFRSATQSHRPRTHALRKCWQSVTTSICVGPQRELVAERVKHLTCRKKTGKTQMCNAPATPARRRSSRCA